MKNYPNALRDENWFPCGTDSAPPSPQMPKPDRVESLRVGLNFDKHACWRCEPTDTGNLHARGTTTIEQFAKEQAEAAAREKAAREDYEQMALEESRKCDEARAIAQEKAKEAEQWLADLQATRVSHSKLCKAIKGYLGYEHWPNYGNGVFADNIIEDFKTKAQEKADRVEELEKLLGKLIGPVNSEIQCLKDELNNEDGVCHTLSHQQRFGMLNAPLQEIHNYLTNPGEKGAEG